MTFFFGPGVRNKKNVTKSFDFSGTRAYEPFYKGVNLSYVGFPQLKRSNGCDFLKTLQYIKPVLSTSVSIFGEKCCVRAWSAVSKQAPRCSFLGVEIQIQFCNQYSGGLSVCLMQHFARIASYKTCACVENKKNNCELCKADHESTNRRK